MDKVDGSFSSPSTEEVVQIHKGVKFYWRTRNTIDVLIVEHKAHKVIEIISYEPSIDREAERIYIDATFLRQRIDQTSIDDQLSFAFRNNVPLTEEYVRGINEKAESEYLLKRLFIAEFSADLKLIRVEIQFSSTDIDDAEHRKLLCDRPEDLQVFKTPHYRSLVQGVVEKAMEALKEEQRLLAEECEIATALEESIEEPLSVVERWRIPIVFVKVSNSRNLTPGDAKILRKTTRNMKSTEDAERMREALALNGERTLSHQAAHLGEDSIVAARSPLSGDAKPVPVVSHLHQATANSRLRVQSNEDEISGRNSTHGHSHSHHSAHHSAHRTKPQTITQHHSGTAGDDEHSGRRISAQNSNKPKAHHNNTEEETSSTHQNNKQKHKKNSGSAAGDTAKKPIHRHHSAPHRHRALLGAEADTESEAATHADELSPTVALVLSPSESDHSGKNEASTMSRFLSSIATFSTSIKASAKLSRSVTEPSASTKMKLQEPSAHMLPTEGIALTRTISTEEEDEGEEGGAEGDSDVICCLPESSSVSPFRLVHPSNTLPASADYTENNSNKNKITSALGSQQKHVPASPKPILHAIGSLLGLNLLRGSADSAIGGASPSPHKSGFSPNSRGLNTPSPAATSGFLTPFRQALYSVANWSTSRKNRITPMEIV